MSVLHSRQWLFGMLATMPALALVAAACGGGGGDGSDEGYVKAICEAFDDFDQGMTDAQEDAQDIDPTDEDATDQFLDLFADPFADFADAVEDANPPEDIEEFHDEFARRIRQMADAIEDGDLETLNELDNLEDFEPPQDVQDRLAAVAADTEACEGIDVFE